MLHVHRVRFERANHKINVERETIATTCEDPADHRAVHFKGGRTRPITVLLRLSRSVSLFREDRTKKRLKHYLASGRRLDAETCNVPHNTRVIPG